MFWQCNGTLGMNGCLACWWRRRRHRTNRVVNLHLTFYDKLQSNKLIKMTLLIFTRDKYTRKYYNYPSMPTQFLYSQTKKNGRNTSTLANQ